MARPILTPNQTKTLQAIASSTIPKYFYFTSGTALSHYYLQHRFSEDLDFFSVNEFDLGFISTSLKKLQTQLKFQTLDIQQSFNRNLIFLTFANQDVLKLEFTYYPFTHIETPQLKDGIPVDSLIDITVNKLFTIAQNPRGRDFYDLYASLQHTPHDLEKLRLLAKQKFDWHVDPLHLGTQFNRIDEFLDDPILTKTIDSNSVSQFFKDQAKKLKPSILN